MLNKNRSFLRLPVSLDIFIYIKQKKIEGGKRDWEAKERKPD